MAAAAAAAATAAFSPWRMPRATLVNVFCLCVFHLFFLYAESTRRRTKDPIAIA